MGLAYLTFYLWKVVQSEWMNVRRGGEQEQAMLSTTERRDLLSTSLKTASARQRLTLRPSTLDWKQSDSLLEETPAGTVAYRIYQPKSTSFTNEKLPFNLSVQKDSS